MTEGSAKPALVTVHSIDGPPTLEQAARQIGVSPQDILADFGIVPVDAAHGVYCVHVVATRLPVDFSSRRPFHGPFADVPIVPLRQGHDKDE